MVLVKSTWKRQEKKIVFATVLISYQALDGHMVDGREINEINVNPLQQLEVHIIKPNRLALSFLNILINLI